MRKRWTVFSCIIDWYITPGIVAGSLTLQAVFEALALGVIPPMGIYKGDVRIQGVYRDLQEQCYFNAYRTGSLNAGIQATHWKGG